MQTRHRSTLLVYFCVESGEHTSSLLTGWLWCVSLTTNFAWWWLWWWVCTLSLESVNIRWENFTCRTTLKDFFISCVKWRLLLPQILHHQTQTIKWSKIALSFTLCGVCDDEMGMSSETEYGSHMANDGGETWRSSKLWSFLLIWDD